MAGRHSVRCPAPLSYAVYRNLQALGKMQVMPLLSTSPSLGIAGKGQLSPLEYILTLQGQPRGVSAGIPICNQLSYHCRYLLERDEIQEVNRFAGECKPITSRRSLGYLVKLLLVRFSLVFCAILARSSYVIYSASIVINATYNVLVSYHSATIWLLVVSPRLRLIQSLDVA